MSFDFFGNKSHHRVASGFFDCADDDKLGAVDVDLLE